MNDWKIIFATVVIFGAGVISGGLLVNYVDLAHIKTAQPVPSQFDATNATINVSSNRIAKSGNGNAIRSRLPEILSKQFVDRLDRQLKLTIGQRASIEKIIADDQDEMRKAFQDIRQEARLKIREALTEPQKKQFDELFKQLRGGKKGGNPTNPPPVPYLSTNAVPAE